MAEQLEPIGIGDDLALLRIVEEVRAGKKPRVLRRDREDLAVVTPLPHPKKRRDRVRSKEDLKAFRSTAGGWKDLIDVDQFIKDVYESRRISTRPPVEL